MSIFLAFLLCIETVMHSYQFHDLVVMEVAAIENGSLISVGFENKSVDGDFLKGSLGFFPVPTEKNPDSVNPRCFSVLPYHRTIWEPPKIS